MTLDQVRQAYAEAGDAGLDLTDSTIYSDEWLTETKAAAVTEGLALDPTAHTEKATLLAIASAAHAEITRRTEAAAVAAAESAAADEALNALASADPAAAPEGEPVEAGMDSDFTADTTTATEAAPAAEAPAETAPAAEATENADGDTAEGTESETATAATEDDTAAGDAADPSSTQEENTNMSTEDNDRVANLEAQVAALAEQVTEARTAAVNLGAAPGTLVPATEDKPVRRTASLTLLADDGDHERTLDVGVLGRKLARTAESNQGVQFNKVIATVQQFEEGTPSLRAGAGSANTELLFQGTQSRRAARTAAAMECGPVARVEDIPNCFIADRPFANRVTNKWALETMRYEYYRSIRLSQIAAPDGVQVVTSAFQAAIDPNDPLTWKECARLDCDDVETVTEQGWAIFSCLILNEFQNMTVIPIAENRIAALAAQTARLSESQLLARLRQLSFQYTATAPLGGGAGLLEIMDAAVAGYEWQDRLSDTTWTPVIPRGLVRALAADHRNRAFCCGDFNVNGLFNDAGYDAPVVVLDDHLGAVTPQWGPQPGTIGGPAVALPTQLARTYRIYLVDFDSIHMGQRNIVSMREMRDLNLMRQNEYAMVMESAESLGRHGCVAPIAIDITLCPSGARSALERYDCTVADYGTDIAVGP